MAGTSTAALWSPQDVADHIGIPVQTLYAWRSQGRGPVGMKLGRHVRYKPADVEKWLQAQRDPRPVA